MGSYEGIDEQLRSHQQGDQCRGGQRQQDQSSNCCTHPQRLNSGLPLRRAIKGHYNPCRVMASTNIPDPHRSVSVVVVSYGHPELLADCLGCISDHYEVIVVENNSEAEAETICRSRAGTIYLSACVNLGFGAGCNLGADRASGEAVVFLNSDTRVGRRTIPTLLAALDAHPRTDVVVPSLVNLDGSLQPSTGPFPAAVSYLFRSLLPRRRRRYYLFGHGRERVADWGSGACMMVRKEAFSEIGGFFPGFFFNFEDVGLCLRLARRGWITRFVPAASALHQFGGSSSGCSLPLVEWHKRRSVLVYFARNRPAAEFHFVRALNGAYCRARQCAGSSPGRDFWAVLRTALSTGTVRDWGSGEPASFAAYKRRSQ